MRRARIAHAGRDVWVEVSEDANTLRLPDGREVDAATAHWLAPVTPGAASYALGLNFADHNKELGFAPKLATPLVFPKGTTAYVGHNGESVRPSDGNQMHPECELVAVIGRVARKVKREDALSYVGGYTIANDYAIREYLENYQRPNARVKNRSATTPLGPWIVDAADVADPQNLTLKTTVNGVVVQEGSTSDMILDVAGLIEYLSEHVTLMPGDMILTGTPHGVHFCNPGDEVRSEIEGIGCLINRLVSA